MPRFDDFMLQKSFADDSIRAADGLYPDDRGPYRYAVRLFEAQTGTLVVEVDNVSLAGAPVVGAAGMVTLTFQHNSDPPVPVRIDIRTRTCALHPMHEEPLADLNTRLASFWKPLVPSPAPQIYSSGEGPIKTPDSKDER